MEMLSVVQRCLECVQIACSLICLPLCWHGWVSVVNRMCWFFMEFLTMHCCCSCCWIPLEQGFLWLKFWVDPRYLIDNLNPNIDSCYGIIILAFHSWLIQLMTNNAFTNKTNYFSWSHHRIVLIKGRVSNNC